MTYTEAINFISTFSHNEQLELLKTAIQQSPEGVVIADMTGRIVFANLSWAKMHGYEKNELIGKDLDIILKKEQIEKAESIEKTLLLRGSWSGEIDHFTKNGSILPTLTTLSLLKDAEAQSIAILGISLDITERKRMEERLSELNFYAGKLNTAKSIQQVYELTLNVMKRTLGFEYAAFMIADKGYLRVVSLIGPAELANFKLPIDGTKGGITVKAASIRKPILVNDVKKDKDYVEGLTNCRSEVAVPIEIDGKLIGVLNVESRKLDAFSEKDITLLQILASHAATAISNIEKREEIQKRSNQFASLMKSSAEMIRSTILRQRLETIAEAIKELGWQRVVISVKDENLETKDPEDVVSVGLTDAEREFLWNHRPAGQVWQERFGPEYERFKIGEFYYLPWNDPWVRKKFSEGVVSSKLMPEEMVDWNPQDLLYAPLKPANGRVVGVLSIDDPSDGKRPTKESLAPLELFIHQAAVAIENAQLIQQLEQRTQELLETQNKLLKSERFAAIGQVAAMVGHDLRNPLTGIAGAAYYLKVKLSSKANKKIREMLELIENDVGHSNKIINDLLEYSREIQLKLTETALESIVKEALCLVEIPKNIHVACAPHVDLKVKVDVEKMKRVFANIIKNAIDAMPKGGKLAIKSRSVDSEVEIGFSDIGIGMTKEVVEKLWTPLFTTKAKGLGLGLAICKRIVEAHGGSISVMSLDGKGTTFTICIPTEHC